MDELMNLGKDEWIIFEWNKGITELENEID